MGTHAIVAYRKQDGTYVAKYSHYGAVEDYGIDIKNATNDNIIKSVINGGSSEPFEGFYNDFQHCFNNLHWNTDMFVETQSFDYVKPKHCKTLKFVKLFATDNYAAVIYVRDLQDGSTKYYEKVSKGKWKELDIETELHRRVPG